jgi:hypothetical protein
MPMAPGTLRFRLTSLFTFAVALIIAGCGSTQPPTSTSSTTTAPRSPKPWHIPPRHPTIHISVSSACPVTLGNARDVKNTGSGLTTTIVPGTPTDALVCRYTSRLERQTRLDESQSRQLGTAIDRVSTAPPHGSYSCPAIIIGNVIIVFSIPGRADVDIWWTDSGCQTLDNGVIGAFEGRNPSFNGFLTTIGALPSAGTRPVQETTMR